MLKEIDKFDASFFGVPGRVADEVDPQGRMLLETTWEAIVDAGINPQSLRGSNTGVYVGYTSVAMPDGVPHEVQRDVQASKVESLLWFQGGSKAFYSNRVSFVFDFHGPSMSIDVACASSMVCLDIAVTDLRLGKCDQAIVCGVSVNLNPFTNHIYQANNIGAPDGRSKVWCQTANGKIYISISLYLYTSISILQAMFVVKLWRVSFYRKNRMQNVSTPRCCTLRPMWMAIRLMACSSPLLTASTISW